MVRLKKREIQEIIDDWSALAVKNMAIDPSLYEKNDVKRGLRDLNGNGVVAGLTNISNIISSKTVDGVKMPWDGELSYRGCRIEKLVRGFLDENRFGFEEASYLLMFGKLPSADELEEYCEIIGEFRTLPEKFVRDIIMKAPSRDIMNTLARGVLTLYAYDKKADDVSVPNVLDQSLRLIAAFPLIAVYSYQVLTHYHYKKSLIIRPPLKNGTTAENILHLLRESGEYTDLEAKTLDLCLVLHAEHGGGNNSTFTTHVVTSSGTDTYSAMAASLCSLKGPKHGGANIKVIQMFADMKKSIPDRSDGSVAAYLEALLNKDAFDRQGLIYGMGHAVYSLSDPRATILKEYIERLAELKKDKQGEFALYKQVERLAPKIIAERRRMYKGVSANIDFYSGFVYNLLGIPEELLTPIFAVSRIVGWSAHRIEELANNGKIIRPGYSSICGDSEYIPLADRE